MVPGHISVKLAEKIFFIGESIQLFEKDRRIEVQGTVLRERETEIYQKLVKKIQKKDSCFRVLLYFSLPCETCQSSAWATLSVSSTA